MMLKSLSLALLPGHLSLRFSRHRERAVRLGISAGSGPQGETLCSGYIVLACLWVKSSQTLASYS